MHEKIPQVYCLKYAESMLPESMIFDGGKREKMVATGMLFGIPILAFIMKNMKTVTGIDIKQCLIPGIPVCKGSDDPG